MRYITAHKIFNGSDFLEEGTVLEYDHRHSLSAILAPGLVSEHRAEKYDGVLLPGFVNAHCHLELSHLRGLVPQKTGLPDFGPRIVRMRGSVPDGEIGDRMKEADDEMFNNGVAAVGDICNTDISFFQKQRSRIFYHSFVELIGLHPDNAEKTLRSGIKLLGKLAEAGLQGSLAAHAPYSCSASLIQGIADFDRLHDLSFSIHNQESMEETKFFKGGPSLMYGLYRSLGLDISWWKPPGISGFLYYLDKISDLRAVLVHNTFTTAEEISSAAGRNIFWCFCPSANLYIEDKLPDFELFSGQPEKICIGTDSLASNTGLDPVKELNYIYKKSIFTVRDVLSMITMNGARALGLHERFGTLKTGTSAGLNLLEITPGEIIFKKRII